MKKIVLGLLFLLVMSVVSAQGVKYHKVTRGETLYSISKRYGLTVQEMVKANPVLKRNTHVQLGQKIIIPGKHGTSATSVKVAAPPKIHSVPSTPDTPYSDVDNTSRRIMREDVTTAADQPVAEKPVTIPAVPLRTSSSNAAEYPVIFNQYASSGYKVKRIRGAANYLGDNTSGNQYLAFYNDAETGSVIKVTNMMNKKTVYVKVVGKVPYADASQEVILKLSNKAARELGAIDEKFLVEVVGCTAN